MLVWTCFINQLQVPALPKGEKGTFLARDYPLWMEKWLGPLPELLLDRCASVCVFIVCMCAHVCE